MSFVKLRLYARYKRYFWWILINKFLIKNFSQELDENGLVGYLCIKI